MYNITYIIIIYIYNNLSKSYQKVHATYCICSKVVHAPPPGHGHGLHPAPPVDLWRLWV